MRVLKYLVSLPIAAVCMMAGQSYAMPLTSPDGSLTITFERGGCSTGKISGTYSTKSDVSGVLYQLDCTVTVDQIDFFFIDTQGSERCYGKMINSWGGRGGEYTHWTVLGAVPGYQCSSIGQTLRQDKMRWSSLKTDRPNSP
jgi:hypothetical protein